VNSATQQNPDGSLSFKTTQYALGAEDAIGGDPTLIQKTLGGMVIPPTGGVLTRGTRLMLEPIQWLPETAGVTGGIDNITKREGVAFVKGQRAFMGSIKFNLMLAHVNRTAVMTSTQHAALAAGGGDANSLALAQQIGEGLPIMMVRMCVVKLRGRDVDSLGSIWKYFDLLSPFPEASSKFHKLMDKSWTLGAGKTAQLQCTLDISSWLGRRNGVDGNLDSPDNMGGYAPGGAPCRPWRACSAADVSAATASSDTYNADTQRIVILFLTNDGTAGGFGLAGDDDVPAPLYPNQAHAQISGFCEMVAYGKYYLFT
jgi:hypothetical protein